MGIKIYLISDDVNHTKYCIFVLCSAFFEAFERNFQAYKLSIFSAMDQLLSLSRGFFFLICTTGSKITISPSDGTSLPPPMDVDGIGGTVKRTVWRHIRSERSHVTTPHDYAALAKQLSSNVQIEFVAKSEIDQQFAFLDAKWEGVMAVPQTHRVHCIQASGADQVKVCS